MAKNKGGQYTANIYVPDSETEVREWLSRQDSASKSMRALIHWAISRWGMEDVFVAEFARTAGKQADESSVLPPSGGATEAAQNPEEKPEEPKENAPAKTPPEQKADPVPPKKRTGTDVVKNWRNLI